MKKKKKQKHKRKRRSKRTVHIQHDFEPAVLADEVTNGVALSLLDRGADLAGITVFEDLHEAHIPAIELIGSLGTELRRTLWETVSCRDVLISELPSAEDFFSIAQNLRMQAIEMFRLKERSKHPILEKFDPEMAWAAKIIAYDALLIRTALRHQLPVLKDLGWVEGFGTEIDALLTLVPYDGWSKISTQFVTGAFDEGRWQKAVGDFVLPSPPDFAESVRVSVDLPTGFRVNQRYTDYERLIFYFNLEGYQSMRRFSRVQDGSHCDYVALVFEVEDTPGSENVVVLDSAEVPNSMYLLRGPWEEVRKVAQLKRSEIIAHALCLERKVHIGNWQPRMEKAVKQARSKKSIGSG